MGRHKIHRHHARLWLWTDKSASITAKIYLKSTKTVQPHKKEKTKTTIHKHAHHIWGQKTICNTTIRIAATWEKRKEIYPIGLWKILFLGRAVDSTLLCPIGTITLQYTNPTEETMRKTHQLLYYIATQEEAVTTYTSNDMKLAVHSDVSYLRKPKSRSRAGGHLFLSNEAPISQNNGAILNIAHIIKYVMTSATEAELAAL